MATMAQLLAEVYRLRLMRGLEDLLRGCGYGRLAGVDEVGRGSLAGPVVAAAVRQPPQTHPRASESGYIFSKTPARKTIEAKALEVCPE